MHSRLRRRLGATLAAAACLTLHAAGAAAQGLEQRLTPGQVVHGFRAGAVYLNDADRPMGARFVHVRTGFIFDALRLESVPQGYLWVNSFPSSDMGEPHTQEHLLLGKGNVGRAVASFESAALTVSNAYTQQWRTVYVFHTAAGPQVFYDLFERRMDALLHPDYTDEEIRREVRNFGVAEDPATKTLKLEEKGSVYNEMVSSFNNPGSRLFRTLARTLYGPTHPLAYVSGGTPEALRVIRPEHIRAFHKQTHQLSNMGMVGSFPEEMPLDSVLRRLDAALVRLQGKAPVTKPTMTEATMPPPRPAAPPGTIMLVDYPHQSEQQPGSVVFAWPAALHLSARERLLLQLFLSSFAGDATTTLYKKFVDTKTREMDVGAKSVYGSVSDERGHPVYIGLGDVLPAHMTEAQLTAMRRLVQHELARVAALPDSSAELEELNARVQSRVIASRRELAKFVNSPPGFGFRGSYSGWNAHLDDLNELPGFRKSVTMKRELAFVDSLLGTGKNVWRTYLPKWKLTTVTPYAAAARPSPEMLKREEAERQARVAAEVARLKQQYAVADEQEAIRRYKASYDSGTAELERLAKGAASRVIDAPPMTLDDQLRYRVDTLSAPLHAAGGAARVPMVVSTFENMTSATTGIALRLDRVPEDQLLYLSALPALLTRVGVTKDGRLLSFQEMSEAQRREILGLTASFSTNLRTGRAELVVRGSGNDLAESQRALGWMRAVLAAPDWRPENLPRIRDVVDQSLSQLRNTTQAPEEYWVNNPANAYRRQDSPLLLATASFLTQTHNLHRLRWLLKDAGAGAERDALAAWLTRLAGAANGGAARADLKALLAAVQKGAQPQAPAAPAAAPAPALPAALAAHADEAARLTGAARQLAADAARDLDLTLSDVPDVSLAADWAYLVDQMRRDLLVPPAAALAALDSVRQRVVAPGNARMFLIGSAASQAGLAAPVGELLAALRAAPAAPVAYSSRRLVDERLRARSPELGAGAPLFVGLLHPNGQGGVFLNSAPLVTYQDTSSEAVLRFLAAKLYGGGGAHSIFMKTWGAGLAYSNGLGSSPGGGRLSYYAERTPQLPQTLKFVIEELKRAPRDSGLVDYAVAQLFNEFRSASGYEARGEGMAADLADGLTPDVVRRFRQKVLDVRRTTPNLSDALYDRMLPVYGTVLPGLGPKAADVPGAVNFVIGPAKQFDLYEEYLKSVEGPAARLYRLFPRDFWMAPVTVLPNIRT